MELSPFLLGGWSFLTSKELWLGIVTSVSFWLLLTAPLVTFTHQRVYRPVIRDTGDKHDHDYVVYLAVHFSILLTSLLTYTFESVQSVVLAYDEPYLKGIVALRVIGIIAGFFAFWKIWTSPEELVEAYKKFSSHDKPLNFPKCRAVKYRLGALWFFLVATVIEIAITFYYAYSVSV